MNNEDFDFNFDDVVFSSYILAKIRVVYAKLFTIYCYREIMFLITTTENDKPTSLWPLVKSLATHYPPSITLPKQQSKFWRPPPKKSSREGDDIFSKNFPLYKKSKCTFKMSSETETEQKQSANQPPLERVEGAADKTSAQRLRITKEKAFMSWSSNTNSKEKRHIAKYWLG